MEAGGASVRLAISDQERQQKKPDSRGKAVLSTPYGTAWACVDPYFISELSHDEASGSVVVGVGAERIAADAG